MKRATILLCLLLAGCSRFKLGGLAYCPHGQACTFDMRPQSEDPSLKPTSDAAFGPKTPGFAFQS